MSRLKAHYSTLFSLKETWWGRTFSPEAEAPLCCGNMSILVGVTGVEEGPDADLIFVQVDSRQLCLIQEEVTVCVKLGKHPADRILAAGYQALVQYCEDTQGRAERRVRYKSNVPSVSCTGPLRQPSLLEGGVSAVLTLILLFMYNQ